jgi:hypothetical protein
MAHKVATKDGLRALSTGRRQWLIVAISSFVVLIVCVGGAWWAFAGISGAGDVAVDKRETLALKKRWQASYDAIVPIAKDFTGTTSGAIDVGAYTARIDRARTVVDAINGIPVTVADNIGIRDKMLSGASEVLDGMDSLLQAASKNDTPSVETAVIAIDEGSTTLKEAGAALDAKMAARGWR